ncbi:hypothetical protein [Aureimonas sp. AU40]|uniref:hypothetical protein n=1 Tax=Aureimonas sp. AU40 TaxID=1637747 RepID=UPI00078143AF|nr:hypothetical protein [Aureimonas sp. AU40]
MLGIPNELWVVLLGTALPALFVFLGTVVQKRRPDPIGTAAIRQEPIYVMAAGDRVVFEGIRDAIQGVVDCVEDGGRTAKRGIDAVEDLARAIELLAAEARARRVNV